jgi:hypothetical protein
MTEFATKEAVARVADVVDAPHVRSEIDRTFGLPTGLYVGTVLGYLGFLGVMSLAFMNAELALPMIAFALSIVAGFGVPTMWARMNPAKRQGAMSYGTFRHRGIETATGLLSGGAATVQVLILPVLIFLWGIAAAVIALTAH